MTVIAAALAGCGDLSLDAGGAGGFLLASSVSAGDNHSCAVSSGNVKCWGRNNSGQLGDNSAFDAPSPVLVTGITDAVQVSAGGGHTCARLSDGTVWCWGSNTDGQLGDGTTAGSRVPVQVKGISASTGISAGGNHTCAVLADGTVWCWGNNLNGQLGNGTFNDANSPVQVINLTTTASAVAAGGTHTCALLTDGTVRCWGSNVLEQLGNAFLLPGSRSNVPVIATTVASAVEISAGANHNCVSVTSPGTRVRCWGNNFSGQLGSAWTTIFIPAPVVETTSNDPLTVNGITTPAGSVAAGLDHSCAVLSNDNTVRCWGENGNGQLGNFTTFSFVPPGAGASPSSTVIPVTVSGINEATQVTAGLFHSCALLTSNRVMCWGQNSSGQLGDGSLVSSFTPVLVTDNTGAGLQ